MPKCMVVSKNKMKSVNLIHSSKIAILDEGESWNAVIAATAISSGAVLADDSEVIGIEWDYICDPLYTTDDWRKILKSITTQEFKCLLVFWN